MDCNNYINGINFVIIFKLYTSSYTGSLANEVGIKKWVLMEKNYSSFAVGVIRNMFILLKKWYLMFLFCFLIFYFFFGNHKNFIEPTTLPRISVWVFLTSNMWFYSKKCKVLDFDITLVSTLWLKRKFLHVILKFIVI